MFVAINNRDKSAIVLDGEIKRTRNNGEITPEFAMEILSLTNHRYNIKKLVNSIKDICTTKESLMPYREFILSCVDGREVEGEAFDNLREMARICACEEEFDEANKKPKFYDKLDCDNTIIVKSRQEFSSLKGENLKVFFDKDDVDLSEANFSKIKSIKFRDGANIDFEGAKNLGCNLDVSNLSRVSLKWCDLRNINNLNFKDGAKVCLSQVKRPRYSGEDWDTLGGSSNISEEDAYIPVVKYLPKDLDVSMCAEVDLSGCNLSEFGELKFREGAHVKIVYTDDLPKDLDVSMCARVDLLGCNLVNVPEIKFREGATISLIGTKNLPEELDVSMSADVCLYGADLSNLKKIKFKDEEQEKEFMDGAKNFSGKVVYSIGEEKEVDIEEEKEVDIVEEKSGFGAKLRRLFGREM